MQPHPYNPNYETKTALISLAGGDDNSPELASKGVRRTSPPS